MAISKLADVKIRGVCCALPDNEISIQELGKPYFSEEEIEKVSEISGIKKLYHAKPGQTAGDLCYEAAHKLISDLQWEKESIDAILFISQTPDYITPATSHIIHNRLNLSRECIALDVNLGCSGYVYGIWLAGQFISSGTCKRIILLAGDTLTRTISKQDKSVSLIFSDGASATALEYCEGQGETTFVLNSDGSGTDSLIIPAGGFRKPYSESTKTLEKDDDGNVRSQENLYMNGIEIFGFAVREVPIIVKRVLESHGWNINDVDQFLFHQANNYMLKYIAKKAKLPSDKIPLNIDKFGNTSAATLPLLICDQLKEPLKSGNINIVMAGFGVGLSWGAAAMNLSHVHCSEIIYV